MISALKRKYKKSCSKKVSLLYINIYLVLTYKSKSTAYTSEWLTYDWEFWVLTLSLSEVEKLKGKGKLYTKLFMVKGFWCIGWNIFIHLTSRWCLKQLTFVIMLSSFNDSF